MASTATREKTETSQAVTKSHVTVPEQYLSLVRDSRKTASTLGSALATFAGAVMNSEALAKAREGKYLIAVDPVDLPAAPGWYLVDRKSPSPSIKFILPSKASELTRSDRWLDVVYVTFSAIDAAKEKRPVALDVRSGCFIDVSDWPPYTIARMAVSMEEAKPEDALRQ